MMAGHEDQYIRQLRSKLRFMKKGAREGILAEMRSHIQDRSDELGGVTAAIAAMETPKQLAKLYRGLYGKAWWVSILLIIPGVFMAVASSGLNTGNTDAGGTFCCFFIFLVYLFFVASYAGRWAALTLAIIAVPARGLAAVVSVFQLAPFVDPLAGLGAFVFATCALIPIALLAGKGYKKYQANTGAAVGDLNMVPVATSGNLPRTSQPGAMAGGVGAPMAPMTPTGIPMGSPPSMASMAPMAGTPAPVAAARNCAVCGEPVSGPFCASCGAPA